MDASGIDPGLCAAEGRGVDRDPAQGGADDALGRGIERNGAVGGGDRAVHGGDPSDVPL